MFIITTWALRCFGLSGILGSILFICGDLSYQYIPGSKDSPAGKMSRLPGARLLNAGTFGLFGCWFYLLGSLHVYLAFRPVGEIFGFILLLAFAAIMVCYGISHTAYFSIASGAKAAVEAGSDPETGGKLGNAFFKRMVTITYLPAGIASLMMAYGIVLGKSMYPRWMVIFLPLIIYFLKTPVARILKGRLGEIVNDSYDNLSLLIFFLISTAVLWNGLVI